MTRFSSLSYFFCALGLLLFWGMLIPPFEVPDEQSHYATVHYLITKGRVPTEYKQNLSLEEEKVEALLGIMTDGTNRYSYHPEYRLPVSDTSIGLLESEIRALDTPQNRTTFTIHQAAVYPPLYYWFASLFYRLGSQGDILMRLFTTRLASVILTACLFPLVILLGRLVLGKEWEACTLSLLVLFYPMTTFVGAAVSSDNLHNLLFTLLLYFCFRVLKSGLTPRLALSAGLVIGLDFLTKPQAYIAIPIFLLAIILGPSHKFRANLSALGIFFMSLFLLSGWQEIPKFFGSEVTRYLAPAGAPYSGLANFKIFITGNLTHLLSAVTVWYWGVFKWQGVVMPHLLWWLGHRLFLLAGLGVTLQWYRDLKVHQFSWFSRVTLYCCLLNLGYFVALTLFDWQFYMQHGRSLGFQARYFMPLLVTQLLILYLGITHTFRQVIINRLLASALLIFYLVLQLAAIYTVAHAYYDLSPFSTFIREVSQYKPFFAKDHFWYGWLSIFGASMLVLLSRNYYLHKHKS